jgi:outer membrane receptor protein involved in Fe transport
MRKRISIATIILLQSSHCLFSQGLPPGMQQNAVVKQTMTGKVKGRIYEAKTETPLPYASVVLYNLNSDSLIDGQITDEKGYFGFDNIPFGNHKLKISSIGYEAFEKIVQPSFKNPEVETGNIFLTSSITNLKEVVATSERMQIELKPDKKVIIVDKDISVKGGTALDALKNAPGVTVNSDDEISLRNSTPIVYVDGKPTNLTMRQIPSDQINTIEIITNPSAKYEASAKGGIININLKKNKIPGYNGNLNLGIGTNNQYYLMLTLNLKEKKWGANFSYNFNSASNTARTYSNRDLFELGQYNGGSYQDITTTFPRQFQFGRLGFDYFIDNRNTLSINGGIVSGKFNFAENQNTKQLDSYKKTVLTSLRTNLQTFGFTNYSTGLSFKHTFPKQGKEYTADLTYSFNQGQNDYDYRTKSYDSIGNLLAFNPEIQLINATTTANILTGQYDFTNEFSERSKIEFGFRGNWSSTKTKQLVNNFNYLTNSEEEDKLLSTHYSFDDIVAASYFIYSGSINRLEYQIGLRAESSNFYASYNDTNSFKYNYPSSISTLAYGLFPNFNFTYKPNSANQFQFSASRKIARPNMFQATPIVFASDKFNYRIGNPLLSPEFVNLMEINYNFSIEGISLLASLYGKYNQHPITNYVYFSDTSNQVLINTFENAEYGYSYGIEPTIIFSKFKNLTINLNANIFHTYIGAVKDKANENQSWSWNAKANLSYKLPLQFTIQLNGNYEAPKAITQGRMLSMYGMDVSLNKEINNLTLSLSISDLFNSRIMRMEYDQETYYQIQSRRRDIRFIKLGLSYRFGKMDASIFKFKRSKTEMPLLNINEGY